MNDNRIILSDQSIVYILSTIESNLDKHLTEPEKAQIIATHLIEYAQNPSNRISISTLKFHQERFINLYLDFIYDGPSIKEQLTDELLTDNVRKSEWYPAPAGTKKESIDVLCNNFLGVKNFSELIKLANNPEQWKTYPPILLDTRNRNLTDVDPGRRSQISWVFYSGNSWAQGSVHGLTEPPRNIMGIECGSFYLPDMFGTIYTEYRQITMFIQEISEQASKTVTGPNGIYQTWFHFLFNVELVADSIGNRRLKLVPAFTDVAEIRFTKPLTMINSFTISFGSPVDPVLFDHDRDLTPGEIVAGTTTTFTTSMIHNLNNGDLVYLEGFRTADPLADNEIIKKANSQYGLPIIDCSQNTFVVPSLNTSACTGLKVDRIIFGSRRFFVPLKLRYAN